MQDGQTEPRRPWTRRRWRIALGVVLAVAVLAEVAFIPDPSPLDAVTGLLGDDERAGSERKPRDLERAWQVDEPPSDDRTLGLYALGETVLRVGDGGLVGLDAESGERRAEHPLDGDIAACVAAPRLVDGMAVVVYGERVPGPQPRADDCTRVGGIDVRTGELRWSASLHLDGSHLRTFRGAEYADIDVAGNTVVTNTARDVRAFAADTGKLRWRHEPDCSAELAADSGGVLLSGRCDSEVVVTKLSLRDGKRLWRAISTGYGEGAQPVPVSADPAAVQVRDSSDADDPTTTLLVLDRDGEVIGEERPGGIGEVQLVDGRLLVAGSDLVAYDPETGKQLWTADVPGKYRYGVPASGADQVTGSAVWLKDGSGWAELPTFAPTTGRVSEGPRMRLDTDAETTYRFQWVGDLLLASESGSVHEDDYPSTIAPDLVAFRAG